MRKLEDKQIRHKGRQYASAWSSKMKEETNHCLILYRHLILPDLSSKMRPCGGKRCTEEEALLYFIIIYNLASTHYPIQPLSFSFPNFMVAHGVGVAQAKPACKHTIATRKCYQYNTIRATYRWIHFMHLEHSMAFIPHPFEHSPHGYCEAIISGSTDR